MFHLDKKVAKSSKSFFCEHCDYITSRKSSWEKHLLTKKHKNNCFTFVSKSCKKVANSTFKCEFCNKICKSRTTLWRHKKKCKSQEEFITIKKDKYIKVLENANQKTINNIQNQNNTQNISINLFLNEHCKNAMNLEDFVRNIKVSLQDLDFSTKNGYVKGIENIFIKQLEDLKPTERPIHCSDKKRLQFYVKDDDTWKKDEDHEKLTESIKAVSNIQVKKMTDWEKQNPDYTKDPKKSDKWSKMLDSVIAGENSQEVKKNETKIKKILGKVVDIKEELKGN